MTSRPICFACEATLPQKPEEIVSQILDLTRWPEFNGYGPLPEIKQAEFETKTAEIVGTRIRVANRDGSTHVEEIVEWEPTRRLRLHMHEFSPPVSRMATAFDETWEFEQNGDRTKVIRSFKMHPKSTLTRPLLWLIAANEAFSFQRLQVDERAVGARDPKLVSDFADGGRVALFGDEGPQKRQHGRLPRREGLGRHGNASGLQIPA